MEGRERSPTEKKEETHISEYYSAMYFICMEALSPLVYFRLSDSMSCFLMSSLAFVE